MKEEEVNELATTCGISSEEYKSILENFKTRENDLSIENIDLEKEITPTSNLRLFTGIPDIDEVSKGLKIGVNIIAGFRKCCKTTLALNLIYKALNDGLNVCMLSLEMLKTDVLNTLLSLHTFELDPATAVTRDELSMMYELDKDRYTSYLNSFLSLPGTLIIFTEKEIEKNAKSNGGYTYTERNLNDICNKANKSCYEKTGKPVEILVVDNLNCVRVWDKKTTGEPAYTAASNYFRRVALNFGTKSEYEDVPYGEQPVICLLLCQINRTGGKTAEYEGFYPESTIAETVNIERDATTVIPIYANQYHIESNIAMIKLEASRHSKGMLSAIEIPINLAYGKIGYPIGKINVDEEKKRKLDTQSKYRLVRVESSTGEEKDILLPKDAPIPAGYKEVDED